MYRFTAQTTCTTNGAQELEQQPGAVEAEAEAEAETELRQKKVEKLTSCQRSKSAYNVEESMSGETGDYEVEVVIKGGAGWWQGSAASSKQKQSKLPPPFRQLNKFDTAKATWDTDFNCSSNFNFDSDYVSAHEKVKKGVGKGEG